MVISRFDYYKFTIGIILEVKQLYNFKVKEQISNGLKI